MLFGVQEFVRVNHAATRKSLGFVIWFHVVEEGVDIGNGVITDPFVAVPIAVVAQPHKRLPILFQGVDERFSGGEWFHSLVDWLGSGGSASTHRSGLLVTLLPSTMLTCPIMLVQRVTSIHWMLVIINCLWWTLLVPFSRWMSPGRFIQLV